MNTGSEVAQQRQLHQWEALHSMQRNVGDIQELRNNKTEGHPSISPFAEAPGGERTLPRQGQRQNQKPRPLTAQILKRELRPLVLKSRAGVLAAPRDFLPWTYRFKGHGLEAAMRQFRAEICAFPRPPAPGLPPTTENPCCVEIPGCFQGTPVPEALTVSLGLRL